ncbi:MAG: CopD family protein [Burkholderiales bacterium]
MKIALLFHVLGIVVWVGGMFFAYLALRPAAALLLEPPQRLALWQDTLRRFFNWVWLAIAFVLGSGLWMFFRMGGFTGAPMYVHAMLVLGLTMMGIFVHVFFGPFRRLTANVAAKEWKSAGAALNQIRVRVALNLALGLLTIAIATLLAALL